MNRRRRFAFSAVAPIFLALAATLAVGSEPEKKSPTLAEQITSQVGAVMKQSRSAICRVVSKEGEANFAATGFFVDDAGTFITTYLVGGESEDIEVAVGEEEPTRAQRIGADARAGLAVLKVETGTSTPFLKLSKAGTLAAGSPVIALGFPIDLGLSPSFGVVAEYNIGFHRRYFATRHLRANLAVQRGEMGSPLLDLNGDVVGIVLSTVEDRSGVFALPAEAIGKTLADIQRHGRVRQGWFGTDIRAAEPQMGSTARVREVRPGGPGERADLRAGDVLLQMGAWKITDPEDVLSAAFFLTAGDPVKIRVARDGREREITIVPEDPPNGEAPTAESVRPTVTTASDDGAKAK